MRPKTILLFLGVLLGVWIHFGLWRAALGSPAEPVRLNAQTWFNVPVPDSFQIRTFDANEKELRFVFARKRVNEAPFAVQTLHTSFDGTVISQSTLLVDTPPKTVRENNDGTIAILQITQSGTNFDRQIAMYGPHGEKRVVTPPEPVDDFTFVNNVLVGINSTHLVMIDPPSQPLPIPGDALLWPYSIQPMGSSQVFSLELGEARLHLSDLKTVSFGLTLAAPEIQGILRPQRRPDLVEAIATNAVANARGDIFCGITGRLQQFTQGAVVLQLDQKGAIVHRIRCLLPNIANSITAVNPNGAMYPEWVAANNRYLFWISRHENVVARYPLP